MLSAAAGRSRPDARFSIAEPASDGGIVALASEMLTPKALAKLNLDGTIAWRIDERDDHDAALDVQPTPDGGYIVVGYTSLWDSPADNRDAWALKLYPDGEVQWQPRVGGGRWSRAPQLAARYPPAPRPCS